MSNSKMYTMEMTEDNSESGESVFKEIIVENI